MSDHSGLETAPFLPLDIRVIDLWRLQQFISSCILLGITLVLALIFGLGQPALWHWLLGAWIALALLRGFLWFWYPPRAYRAWGFRIDEKVLEIRSGIFFQVVQLLPLSRLQHVDLHRGPFERYFGLASLILYTAGTHEAALTIPGLDAGHATHLRDQLVAIGGDDGV